MTWAVRIRLLAVALAATFLLMIPILRERPRVLAGGDIAAHVQFTLGLLEGLEQGVLYPRWLAEANYGFGGPIFIFYPPLAYYLTALTTWLTGSTIVGFDVAFAIAGVLAAMTFYGACRGLISPRAALLGAFLYTLAPYHAWDLHAGYYAEYVAYAWLPMVWRFARQLLDHPTRKDVGALGLWSAAIVVTHLPTMITVAVTMVPYISIRLLMVRRGTWKVLGALAAAGGIAFLCAAAFLLPMMAERGYIDTEWITQAPFGNYQRWLLSLGMLRSLPWAGPFTGALLLTLVAVAAALSIAFRRSANPESEPKSFNAEATAMCVLVVWTLFLQLSASTPVWKVVPQLPVIQFPWRLNAPHALFCCVLVSLALSMKAVPKGPIARAFGRPILIIGILALPAITHSLTQRKYIDYKFDAHALETDLDLKYLSSRTFTPRRIPRDAPLRVGEGLFPQALWSDEGGLHEVLQWTPEYRELMVSTPRSNRLEIRTFFYPGWTARLNGKVVPPDTPIYPLYLLAVEVPPGENQKLEFVFETTPLRTGAVALSAVGLLVVALMGLPRALRS